MTDLDSPFTAILSQSQFLFAPLTIGVLRERLLLLVLLNLGLNRLRDRDGRRLTRWLGKGAKAELRRWQVRVDAHRRRHLDRLARVVD